ncbi:MAG: FAD-dependent oxidoreductase [Desulfovibrionaceae bacterium]|nr:FAD-dependent oxidoreductase [Desulfovibrionaceae bacterium]
MATPTNTGTSIDTRQNGVRMATEELLLEIRKKVEQGETDFTIKASGQHDIGGPLWNKDGKTITLRVTNPGQRVGAMALPKTYVLVEGSAPADVGWLNAGGTIVVRGDAGDTAGHCAASGTLYIGGRAGTRSGSLMKHDPIYPPPELWVLKSIGSFSFEFMSGGTAVVCGLDCEETLGMRPCVGMVGGTVYARGNLPEIPQDIALSPITHEDRDFLEDGIRRFLAAIGEESRLNDLTQWEEWRKLTPGSCSKRKIPISMKSFREEHWIPNGLFSDVLPDSFDTNGLVATGIYRLRVPVWKNRNFTSPCEHACPIGIATQVRCNLLRDGKRDSAMHVLLEDMPFPASVCGSLCPNLCMLACTRYSMDFPVSITTLNLLSKAQPLPAPKEKKEQHIAVLGGGPAGLAAAWRLLRKGYAVTVFEKEAEMGGKLAHCIPKARLAPDCLAREIERIREAGASFVVSHPVDAQEFLRIRRKFAAVILACGTSKIKDMSIQGSERLLSGTAYLRSVREGKRVSSAQHVLIIGLGNEGIDCCEAAYALGAESVTCLDSAHPKAFPERLARAKELGARILWPCSVRSIDKTHVLTEDGQRIEAEECILCTGEIPDFSYLPADLKPKGDFPETDASQRLADDIFVVGDAHRGDLVVQAIASANQAVDALDCALTGKTPAKVLKRRIPYERLHTAWFEKVGQAKLPSPENDYERCISCGTCRDCHTCEISCPERAIVRIADEHGVRYEAKPERCIGCGICSGVCPAGIWDLCDNEPLA